MKRALTKAGLLVCDHVKPEYQDQFGDYPDMFTRLFPNFEWTFYDVYNGHFPEDLKECDVYMATGSKHSVYEDIEWITKLKKLIGDMYEQGCYFIGFCFGHQLIGEALGGKVGKSPNGWCVGVHQFEINMKEDWMTPPADQFNMLMMCQDQVLELPPETQVLAKSELCPAAMIKVGSTFLGIQAHPEFTKDYDQMLMETRMNKMGDEVALLGIKSLTNDIHPRLLHDWITNFLIAQ